MKIPILTSNIKIPTYLLVKKSQQKKKHISSINSVKLKFNVIIEIPNSNDDTNDSIVNSVLCSSIDITLFKQGMCHSVFGIKILF